MGIMSRELGLGSRACSLGWTGTYDGCNLTWVKVGPVQVIWRVSIHHAFRFHVVASPHAAPSPPLPSHRPCGGPVSAVPADRSGGLCLHSSGNAAEIGRAHV